MKTDRKPFLNPRKTRAKIRKMGKSNLKEVPFTQIVIKQLHLQGW